MTDTDTSSGRLWTYRFAEPDGDEIETLELSGDEAAEMKARELSTTHDVPIRVHRRSAHVDSWEYVTEVDERT